MKYFDISYCQTNKAISDIMSKNADGVIIRNGYKNTTDTMFNTHIKNAIKANVPAIGSYIFFMATNYNEAKAEAENAISRLAPYKSAINAPIFLDFEDLRAGCGKNITFNTDLLMYEMRLLKDAGYNVGIYTNHNYILNYIDLSRIMCNNYLQADLWLADYRSVPYNPIYPVSMWQYGTETINGVKYDANYCYVDYARRALTFGD